MGTVIQPPKRTAVAAPAVQTTFTNQKQVSLSEVRTRVQRLPTRNVTHGPPGTGKTSFAAQIPNAVVQMAGTETGLLTLISEGQLPEVPHFPPALDWETLNAQVDALLREPHAYRYFILDTVNLWERLCYEHVCRVHFQDDWSRSGWQNFNAGPEMALAYEREYLQKLDTLREEKRMGIMLLAHTQIKNFRNPEGADYDRFLPDLNAKTWALIDRWSDNVFFLNYETRVAQVVETGKSKARRGKGVGLDHRVLYTRRTAAYDAKNRLGLEGEIDMGTSAVEGYANFVEAIQQARAAGLNGTLTEGEKQQ